MNATEGCSYNLLAESRHADAGAGFLLWRSRFYPGLEILWGSAHVHRCRHHLHETFKVAWLVSGAAEVTYRGRTWSLNAGDAFLAAPLEPHGGGGLQGTPLSYVALYVPQEVLGEINPPCTPGILPLLPRFALRMNALRLYDELVMRLRSVEAPARQRKALVAMFRAFLTSEGPTIRCGRETTHRAVGRIRAILDEAFDDDVAVRDLARAVHLHERYVISLFKRAMGIPPHQYLIARRVERARMLLGDHLSLSAAAVTVGFTDQSHFTRIFRRAYGCTPGAYQRDVLDESGRFCILKRIAAPVHSDAIRPAA